MKWEKIFAKHVFDKALMSKMYEELIQLNCKKPQITHSKNGHRTWVDIFFQRRPTNGQHIYEKVLNITNHQGNANQNHKEISPHTS